MEDSLSQCNQEPKSTGRKDDQSFLSDIELKMQVCLCIEEKGKGRTLYLSDYVEFKKDKKPILEAFGNQKAGFHKFFDSEKADGFLAL